MLPAGEDEPRRARPRREDGGSEEPSVLPWKSVGRAPRAELATPRARGASVRAAASGRRAARGDGSAGQHAAPAEHWPGPVPALFVFFSRGSHFKLPLASVLSATHPVSVRRRTPASCAGPATRSCATSGESLACGGSVAPSVGRR